MTRRQLEHTGGGGGDGSNGGFYCGDLALRYPYHECTITVPMLLVCMLLMPMLFISIVEVIRRCKHFEMRKYLRELWRSEAVFSFGFIATYLTTELAKNVVGRMRPHFYTACQPRMPDGSSCEQPPADVVAATLYVSQYYCSNKNLSLQQQRELYVSFPSAHASLSFYSMLFLGFYLHAVCRQHRKGICRVFKHMLQFLLLLTAWYFALSRVADHWHHWTDVLAGGIMGSIYAILTAIYVGEFLQPRSSSKKRSCLISSSAPSILSSATEAKFYQPPRESSSALVATAAAANNSASNCLLGNNSSGLNGNANSLHASQRRRDSLDFGDCKQPQPV